MGVISNSEIGILVDVLENMKTGVYNFCVDGKCIGCGNCCSALLPVSKKELKVIKAFVKNHNVKPHRHAIGIPTKEVLFDATCPFLDNTKQSDKCDIYPVRPDICRKFQCNKPQEEIDKNKDMFRKKYEAFFMWDLFDEVSE